MTNFWQKLKKPITILAPMDGVTDIVFRRIVASVGRPTVFFTEFVSIDGLLSQGGREKTLQRLKFDESERPIVAQIWGNDPEKFFEAAKLIKSLGFDGVDINMGCPVSDVIKTGSCSALIKNPDLAIKIIEATITGAENLPVSVKTRIGFNTIDTENWVKTLLSTKISALTLHLRTVKEMSKVPAHWEEVKKAVKIRDEIGSECLIIGNGDIKSLSQAAEMVDKYKVDGVMVGRGIFDNVWVFNSDIPADQITPKQKVELLLKHLDLYKKTWDKVHHFETLKKFVKCYINNFPGASEIREKLMGSKTLAELRKLTAEI